MAYCKLFIPANLPANKGRGYPQKPEPGDARNAMTETTKTTDLYMPRPRTSLDPVVSEMVTYSVDAEDQNFIGPIAQDESTTL